MRCRAASCSSASSRGAGAHEALEAAAAGDEGQHDHLDARGDEDGEEVPLQDGEAQGGAQADQVVLALEGVGEVVRLFGRVSILDRRAATRLRW